MRPGQMSDPVASADAESTATRAGALPALLLLLLAYILSFIDRNVMAVLVGPIRQDFAISDFQYSLLHGLAFSLFYIVLGLPIARLADRGNRTRIIAAGVFLWSLMTCLCGVARSFQALFLARIGVGVGEAALSPPAYSLLSDYFSPRALPRAIAVYTLGITIGGGLAYIIGGAVFRFFSEYGPLTLPLFGELRPWQTTFVAVGLPGFLVAVLLLWLQEPERRGLVNARSYPLGEVAAYLRRYWQTYLSLMTGVSLLAVLGYGTMAWYPEFLVRTQGLERADAGAWFGAIFIVAGSLGTLAGGWSSAPLQRRGVVDANMRLVAWIALLWLPPAVLGPLLPGAGAALLAAVPIVFFLNAYFGLSIAAIQLVTPNRMRAQISAVMLFMTNLFGLALGPSAVAALTDFLFRNDLALGWSLALLPLLVCPLAALILFAGLPYYRQRIDTIARETRVP
jgi:MFS family permease